MPVRTAQGYGTVRRLPRLPAIASFYESDSLCIPLAVNQHILNLDAVTWMGLRCACTTGQICPHTVEPSTFAGRLTIIPGSRRTPIPDKAWVSLDEKGNVENPHRHCIRSPVGKMAEEACYSKTDRDVTNIHPIRQRSSLPQIIEMPCPRPRKGNFGIILSVVVFLEQTWVVRNVSLKQLEDSAVQPRL